MHDLELEDCRGGDGARVVVSIQKGVSVSVETGSESALAKPTAI